MANLSDAKGHIVIESTENTSEEEFKRLVSDILSLVEANGATYGILYTENDHYEKTSYMRTYTANFTGVGRWNFSNFLREAAEYADETPNKSVFDYDWSVNFDYVDISFDDMFLYEEIDTWTHTPFDGTNIVFDAKDQVIYPFTSYNLIDVAGYTPYELSDFTESDYYVKKFMRYIITNNCHLTDSDQSKCLHIIDNLSLAQMEQIRKDLQHSVWCSRDEEYLCDYLLNMYNKQNKNKDKIRR